MGQFKLINKRIKELQTLILPMAESLIKLLDVSVLSAVMLLSLDILLSDLYLYESIFLELSSQTQK